MPGTCELIVFLNGMHELAITQGILSVVLEQAEANQASKITKIDLTIGELSGIASECVEFYFDVLSTKRDLDNFIRGESV